MVIIFSHTITVYNKYTQDRVEKWQRTVLTNVFFDSIKGASVRRTGVVSSDSVQIIIPFRKGYKEPKDWLKDKANSFTLQTGDIVIKGVCDVEIEKSSSELKEYRPFNITSVDTKDFGLKHWEVSCK